MARRNQHVVPHSEGWAVKAEGSSRATRIFMTQDEAIEYGREIAINQHAELVIHNRKGEVRKRRNYKKHWSHEPHRYFFTPANYAPVSPPIVQVNPVIPDSVNVDPTNLLPANLLPANCPPYLVPPQSANN